MKVFYGAAIQGNQDRSLRQPIHRALIETIKAAGYAVLSEHTTGASYDETIGLLEASIGDLPPLGWSRTVFIRNKMIELVEGDIDAAVFEVSVPSLGTGIEIAHAYLRPRLGLKGIPILALYEKDFWPHSLSSMVKGLSQARYPNFHLKEYDAVETACMLLRQFLNGQPSAGEKR